MELGPIFRSLLNSRSRVALIVVEIALTLAIVANCMNMILDQTRLLNRPSGMDEEKVLVVTAVPLAAEESVEKERMKARFEEDLRALREMPGVAVVSSSSAAPLSGSGSSAGWRLPDTEDDAHRFTIPYYFVGPGIVETLGLELVAGRNFAESDWPAPEETEEEAAGEGEEDRITNVIVTQEVADLFYPEGDAVGSLIEAGGKCRIVGVLRQMTNSWPQSSIAGRVLLYPHDAYGSQRNIYLVRAREGMVDSLYANLESEMLRLDKERIIYVKTLAEYKHDSMRELGAINTMLAVISGLLLVVTSLGIVGLTSFSVTQRTKQIGTRRALGATRWAVLRYFLVENWVLTGCGLAIGFVMTYGVNYLLAQIASLPIMDLWLVLAGMFLLWITGLLAALAPAVRSMAVSPVVATQTV